MTDAPNLDPTWWLRFTIGAAMMALPSFLRLLFTWDHPLSDGFQQFGWPFLIYEYGGFGGGGEEHFTIGGLIADLAILLAFAVVYAESTRDGFFELIGRLRTWGTPREQEPE